MMFVDYMKIIPSKLTVIKKYLSQNNINYEEVDYQYDEGNGEFCRQKGFFKYFII